MGIFIYIVFPLRITYKYFSPQSTLNDPMHILLVLVVLALVEDQHTVHLVICRNNIMSPLRDTVDLTLFSRVVDCSQGVLFDLLGSKKYSILDQLLVVPVLVPVFDSARKSVSPLELARFSTRNCNKNNW
jgi:hypothetical protein